MDGRWCNTCGCSTSLCSKYDLLESLQFKSWNHGGRSTLQISSIARHLFMLVVEMSVETAISCLYIVVETSMSIRQRLRYRSILLRDQISHCLSIYKESCLARCILPHDLTFMILLVPLYHQGVCLSTWRILFPIMALHAEGDKLRLYVFESAVNGDQCRSVCLISGLLIL
jgi:N-acyl-L-homoserine lactone synthetase